MARTTFPDIQSLFSTSTVGEVDSTILSTASGATAAQLESIRRTVVSGTTGIDGFPVLAGIQSGFNDNPPSITPGLADSTSSSRFISPTGETLNNPSAYIQKRTSSGRNTISPKIDFSLSEADKRLYTVRSRAATGSNEYTSDRGPIASMKLLKGPDYDPLKSLTGNLGDINTDVQALLSDSGFANFFITDIQWNFSEKMQIMQTFGDNEVVYYFGRQPMIVNLGGLLFDSIDNDWFTKFLRLYAGILRGSQLARNFSLVELRLPNMILKGSIANLNPSQNSARDTDIPFQMQFVAKEVVPLPARLNAATVNSISGKLIDFKATREGVKGYSIGSGSLGGGWMESSKVVGNLGTGTAGATTSVTSSLNAFRTNIFTPVFGVISSITKIVKTVTGTISNIISSFTNPINQILRDINSVATQATTVAKLVENSVNNIISVPNRILNNVRNTIRSLRNAAGTIIRVPENISQTWKRLYGSGKVKRGAAILSSGKARKKSKAAILTSGNPYIPVRSNIL